MWMESRLKKEFPAKRRGSQLVRQDWAGPGVRSHTQPGWHALRQNGQEKVLSSLSDLPTGLGEDGRGNPSRGCVDRDITGICRKRIKLDGGARIIGKGWIAVGERASGTAVIDGNIDSGNRIAILVEHKDCERLRQLRSGRSDLIIAAGDSEPGSRPRHRICEEGGVLEWGGTGGDG